MTSPYYRGEGGENSRHRVTGGASVPVATGRGEGRRFFSAHRLNWVVKLVWVMRVGAPREQRNARDSKKDHRETSSPGRWHLALPAPQKTQYRGTTFQNHRNFGITRHTGGVRRRTPQWRRGTPRGMHRDRNGIRGTREPEENECGRQKNSLEFENRMNSEKIEKSKFWNFNFFIHFSEEKMFGFFWSRKIFFQILKINFRHEKLIFFAQDFFPDKIWLCTFDFWRLLEYPITMPIFYMQLTFFPLPETGEIAT